MGSFGQDLKKAREAKGVTLEAIATATKITTRYLQAVEQERFDQLPGGVFRKSIVRSYARSAGLDEDAWVKRYLEISKPEEIAISEEDRAWAEFAENVGRSRGRDSHAGNSRARWAGVVALLLLVMGMSWFVWGYVHNKAAAAVKGPGVSSALASKSLSTVASNKLSRPPTTTRCWKHMRAYAPANKCNIRLRRDLRNITAAIPA